MNTLIKNLRLGSMKTLGIARALACVFGAALLAVGCGDLDEAQSAKVGAKVMKAGNAKQAVKAGPCNLRNIAGPCNRSL